MMPTPGIVAAGVGERGDGPGAGHRAPEHRERGAASGGQARAYLAGNSAHNGFQRSMALCLPLLHVVAPVAGCAL